MYLHTRELGGDDSWWSMWESQPQDEDDVRHHSDGSSEQETQKWVFIACLIAIGLFGLVLLYVCMSPKARRGRAAKKAAKKAASLAATNAASRPPNIADFAPRTLYFTSCNGKPTKAGLPMGFSTLQSRTQRPSIYGIAAPSLVSNYTPDLTGQYNDAPIFMPEHHARHGFDNSSSVSIEPIQQPLTAAAPTGQPSIRHDEDELDIAPPVYERYTPDVKR